ncbi:MAG: hypothetical protein K6G87_15355 [Butyrivibrio sp.]|uniref:hypothetical protein n=1 Tax=Butyrivibrio sp. TaxID=28121 RepID=UPI0025FBE221|nr:hypothetical protein [Butyrivibrio sp.]MCR5772595.1 hypothetical protein [Butyrivibrio sp.]
MLVHNEEDFKYVMQDFEKYYIGARYSYDELMASPFIPFKFKTIIEKYIAKEIDKSATIESHFYFMTDEGFDYRVCRQLRMRFRCSVLASPHKDGVEDKYTEKIYPIDKLVKLTAKQKMDNGLVIRELIQGKMSLMMFQV